MLIKLKEAVQTVREKVSDILPMSFEDALEVYLSCLRGGEPELRTLCRTIQALLRDADPGPELAVHSEHLGDRGREHLRVLAGGAALVGFVGPHVIDVTPLVAARPEHVDQPVGVHLHGGALGRHVLTRDDDLGVEPGEVDVHVDAARAQRILAVVEPDVGLMGDALGEQPVAGDRADVLQLARVPLHRPSPALWETGHHG